MGRDSWDRFRYNVYNIEQLKEREKELLAEIKRLNKELKKTQSELIARDDEIK